MCSEVCIDSESCDTSRAVHSDWHVVSFVFASGIEMPINVKRSDHQTIYMVLVVWKSIRTYIY